ncbi:LPXTG cell wall anchor domain-containing protein [Nocardioides panzhihuensis]|uniref:LPXTG-motif cell wall-anchored protein n=1 Tax=Nocardioides panzhihuensis TaxID=860243 RepID=A0A7Z0IT33_9ACTN|nr:LPXTG cell wall anchor domain-containing protein [Nocardioides panzhihuensis]NYI78412.1 LPXTG-motif cell wall-anchored protein [Nocardioides panzhihuensis]
MNMHSSTKIGLAAVAVAGVASVVAAPGAQAAQDCKTTTVTSQVKVADEKKTTEVTPAVTHVEHTDAVSHEESRFSTVVKGESHEAVTEDQFRNSVYTRTYTPGTAAVTDTIEHPAETRTVEHPAETHTVEHPAETHVVHHEAVTHEETRVQDRGYAYKQKQTGKVRYLDTPGWNGEDEHGDKGWVRFAEGDLTETVTVVDVAAWDEMVVDKEAWTETVVDREAWTETVVVKEAWTETIVVEEATSAVFGPWQWDRFTTWTTTSGTPADEDGQDGDDNPLNLSQIGEQYAQTVITKEAHTDLDATLYFVEDGEPTTNLADASWTADEPAGWDLVDTRTVEDSAASDVTVVDSPASSVTVVIPAVYETKTNESEKCAAVVKDASTKAASEVPSRIDAGLAGNLPNTGGPNGVLLAAGGLLVSIGGIGSFLARRRRNA